MTNKKKSTFGRFMSDSKQKKKFKKEYAQFLFSEFLLEAMDEEHISVRELSKEVWCAYLYNLKYEINEANQYYHKDDGIIIKTIRLSIGGKEKWKDGGIICLRIKSANRNWKDWGQRTNPLL